MFIPPELVSLLTSVPPCRLDTATLLKLSITSFHQFSIITTSTIRTSQEYQPFLLPHHNPTPERRPYTTLPSISFIL